MNILITSSRAPVALELIRIFGRAGHTVYATYTIPWTLGSHSCYLAKHVVMPPPRYDSPGFACALLEIVERGRVDWLIPTSEEVFFVGKYYDELAARTRVFTAPLAVLAAAGRRARLYRPDVAGLYQGRRGAVPTGM
jgi:hypothetical protein